MPKADELKQLVEEANDLLGKVKLNGKVSLARLAGALERVQRSMRVCSSLTTGYSSCVKPYDIPADISFVYNFATSLNRSYSTLPPRLLAREVNGLSERLEQLRANVTQMHEEVSELHGPTQPAGQPATEGETPADALIDPMDLDDAPDDLEDFDDAGLSQYSQYDMKMPGSESPELVMVLELPVIATFNRPTSIEELNRRGFEAVNLAGYIILRKAYILGVNKAQCKLKGFDPARVLLGALKNMSDKLNDTMSLVCETPVPYAKGGWVYYWIGPSSYHRTLGGHLDTRLTVEDFRFPFSPN
jgi:hypothetical protein